jgi:hypothetical protein
MKPFIRKITLEVLENRLRVVVNVNFPKLTKDKIKDQNTSNRHMDEKNLINDKHHKEERLLLFAGVCKSEDKGRILMNRALGNGYISMEFDFSLT